MLKLQYQHSLYIYTEITGFKVTVDQKWNVFHYLVISWWWRKLVTCFKTKINIKKHEMAPNSSSAWFKSLETLRCLFNLIKLHVHTLFTEIFTAAAKLKALAHTPSEVDTQETLFLFVCLFMFKTNQRLLQCCSSVLLCNSKTEMSYLTLHQREEEVRTGFTFFGVNFSFKRPVSPNWSIKDILGKYIVCLIKNKKTNQSLQHVVSLA